MGKHELPEPTPLEWLQESIRNAPKELEDEFGRTPNTWIACFTSSVNIIETYLGMVQRRKMIPQNQYDLAHMRLERIKVKLDDLDEAYSAKSDIPPQEIRNRLFRQINILRPLEKDEKLELGL